MAPLSWITDGAAIKDPGPTWDRDLRCLERVTRIELASLVWKTKALPLSYTRLPRFVAPVDVLHCSAFSPEVSSGVPNISWITL